MKRFLPAVKVIGATTTLLIVHAWTFGNLLITPAAWASTGIVPPVPGGIFEPVTDAPPVAVAPRVNERESTPAATKAERGSGLPLPIERRGNGIEAVDKVDAGIY